MENRRRRRDAAYLLLLGTACFLLLGIVLMNMGRVALFDFRTAYFSGACLLTHCDPYNESDVAALYAQHHESRPISDRDLSIIIRNIYLPPAFIFTTPLAFLPFDLAETLWFLLIVCSFVLAVFLMVSSANRAYLLAAGLGGFCLANSGSLIYFANPAGFVVPLCILAAWCFVHNRSIGIGIASLALGLAFKPHDVGFVWLFFLLAGGVQRRRALATLAVFATTAIPSFLWMTLRVPNWWHELATNFRFYATPGSVNDPSGGHGTLVLTNLQTIASFFWPDPHAYNLASYLICAPIVLTWAIVTLRARPTRTNAWLSLASVAAISMLPVYHRQYDAKLILLAIPACALLWSRRGTVGWLALTVTSIAFFLNGDLPWVAFLMWVKHIHPALAGAPSRFLTAVWDFPAPLSLLAMGLFYLLVFVKEVAAQALNPDQAGELMQPEVAEC